MKLYDRLNEIEKNHELQKRLRAESILHSYLCTVLKRLFCGLHRCELYKCKPWNYSVGNA